MAYEKRIGIPPSKSELIRMLAMAGRTKGTSYIEHPSLGNRDLSVYPQDVLTVRKALERFGVRIEDRKGAWVVYGGKLSQPREPIDLGNGGLPGRLLLPYAANVDGATVFNADPRLSERMREEIRLLKEMGFGIEDTAGGFPITVYGYGSFPSGHFKITVDYTSELLSGLLMATSGATDSLELEVEGDFVSRGYVDMTLDVIETFGGYVHRHENLYMIARRSLEPTTAKVGGCYSTAAFVAGAALLSGKHILMDGLDPESIQPDKGLLEYLEALGGTVKRTDGGFEVSGEINSGIIFDASQNPDLYPAMMMLAAHTPDKISTFLKIRRLRKKESDRVEAMEKNITRIGAEVHGKKENEDEDKKRDIALVIGRRKKLIGPSQIGPLYCGNPPDHRIALAGLMARYHVENAACIAKSVPGGEKLLAEVWA